LQDATALKDFLEKEKTQL